MKGASNGGICAPTEISEVLSHHSTHACWLWKCIVLYFLYTLPKHPTSQFLLVFVLLFCFSFLLCGPWNICSIHVIVLYLLLRLRSFPLVSSNLSNSCSVCIHETLPEPWVHPRFLGGFALLDLWFYMYVLSFCTFSFGIFQLFLLKKNKRMQKYAII